MKLIVGLGNPGRQYEETRHNMGAMVLRQLARRHHGTWRTRHGAVRLLLPMTMMNESGRALVSLRSRRVALDDLLIVCDDVNLPLGTLRLRPQGSDGGHHGLASCFDALQTHTVPRLRVGVGRSPLPRDLTEFVLSPFDEAERPQAQEALARAVEACEWWAEEGIRVAMNRVNRRPTE